MDAWALTDHGNGNGLAHARAHFNKMKKAGKKYRQLYGVEFYFVPSLLDWRRDYEAHMAKARADRTGKKMQETTDINADDEQGLVIENEDETKTIELDSDEWKRRYHLVVIAKNEVGLKNLFRLVKRSFKEGFYRFPRIDFEMLREHSEGLHVSTACLGGIFSNRVLRGSMQGVSDAVIQRELLNLADRFVDVLQPGAFNLEIQFNNLAPQHTVNRHLIDLAVKTGIPLVATADSHYPDPDKWQARELYKRLAWMGKDINQPLPERDQLKCELYPKNASQMWNEYLKNRELYPFYEEHDERVRDAIERTHDIAWNDCEDTWTDTRAKLPKFDTQEKTAFKQLEDLVWQSLRDHGLDKDQEYVERLEYELSDIEHLGHASYFLTMNMIFHRAKERTLLGPGRGSAPGSLVNYLLGITQIDPLPYKLLWSRFLGRHRVSWPDIDCLIADHLVVTPTGHKRIADLVPGDYVQDAMGETRRVLITQARPASEEDTVYDVYVRSATGVMGVIAGNHAHRLLTLDGQQAFIRDITVGDLLMSSEPDPVVVVAKVAHANPAPILVDITVEGSSTFRVVPFDVLELEKNDSVCLGSIYTYGIDSDAEEAILAHVHGNFARAEGRAIGVAGLV